MKYTRSVKILTTKHTEILNRLLSNEGAEMQCYDNWASRELSNFHQLNLLSNLEIHNSFSSFMKKTFTLPLKLNIAS